MARLALLWKLAVLMTETAGMPAAGPPHGNIDSNCLLQLPVEDASRNASSAAEELQSFSVRYAGGALCRGRCDTVIVVSRKGEDLEWIGPLLEGNSFVIHGDSVDLPFLKLPRGATNTYVPGREEAKYLAYIIMEYGDLPKQMVFLHGHDISRSSHEKALFNPEAVTKSSVVEHVLSSFLGRGRGGEKRFLQYPGQCRRVFSIEYGMKSLWKQLDLVSRIGDLPDAWDSVCCAQFAVSREAVLKWPRRLYEDLYDWILSRQARAKKETRLADSTMALEHSWRLLFDNVTAKRTSPCDDLPLPYQNKRVSVPRKPGLAALSRKLRFGSNGVASKL